MSNTPYEKEKNKGKPEHTLTSGLKLFIRTFLDLLKILGLIFLGGLALILFAVVCLILRGVFRSPFLEAQQVTQTCQVLALPSDSEFCATPDKQTTETLKMTLRQYYPPGSTMIWELKPKWSGLRCMRESCEVSLPIQWYELSIDYDEDGRVERYRTFHLPL